MRDLRALSPGAAAVVCEQARALVSAFVLDKATQRKAILWGHDLQQAHGNLVTEMLAQPLDDYINPDRPGLADGSNVVGADRIQVEGTARAEGIAPASVGLKYHFIDSLGWQQPSVGAIVRFFLRSGTRNFKTTRATSDFRIVADWDFLPQWSLNPNVGVALYESDASHLYAAGLFLATLNYNPSKTRISSSTPASSLLKQDTGKSPSLSISVRPMSSAGTSSSTSVPGHGSQAKRRRGCFCRPASASGFDRRVLHGTGSLDQSLVAASAPSLSSG